MGHMERNAECVCPFCGCLYDHDELVALYDEAASGTIPRDEALAKLRDFQARVLAQVSNGPAIAN